MKILKLACRRVALVKRIEQSRTKLYRMAFAWSHDAMLADDLVQETQILALQKLDQLKDEAALDSWVYMILNNVWLTHLRRNRLKDQSGEDIDQIVIAGSSSPEHEMLTQQVDLMVRNAMEKLPNAQRQVVTLVDLDGLSYGEVADILQIPIGTVMSRLNRARAALSISLNKRCKFERNASLPVAEETNGRSNLRVVK